MARRLLGLSAGNRGGSVEIVLTEALQAARSAGAEVELVRLDDLDLESPPGQVPDDAWWFWERLMEADGLVAAAPIISRTIPGRLKVLIDLLLGPNADRAIVERLLAARASGQEPAVPFRLDERVLRPRVAGLIAVGGSLTPQWKGLALPAMHILTFSMHTAVVDQLVVHGAGTPQSVVLDDAALARSAQLGGERRRPSSAGPSRRPSTSGRRACARSATSTRSCSPAARSSARPAVPPAASTATPRCAGPTSTPR